MLNLSCSLPFTAGCAELSPVLQRPHHCLLPEGPEWLAPVCFMAGHLPAFVTILPGGCLCSNVEEWPAESENALVPRGHVSSLKMRTGGAAFTASEVDLPWSLFSSLKSPGTLSLCGTNVRLGAGSPPGPEWDRSAAAGFRDGKQKGFCFLFLVA